MFKVSGDDLVKVTLVDKATGRTSMTTCSPGDIESVKKKLFKSFYHL